MRKKLHFDNINTISKLFYNIFQMCGVLENGRLFFHQNHNRLHREIHQIFTNIFSEVYRVLPWWPTVGASIGIGFGTSTHYLFLPCFQVWLSEKYSSIWCSILLKSAVFKNISYSIKLSKFQLNMTVWNISFIIKFYLEKNVS